MKTNITLENQHVFIWDTSWNGCFSTVMLELTGDVWCNLFFFLWQKTGGAACFHCNLRWTKSRRSVDIVCRKIWLSGRLRTAWMANQSSRPGPGPPKGSVLEGKSRLISILKFVIWNLYCKNWLEWREGYDIYIYIWCLYIYIFYKKCRCLIGWLSPSHESVHQPSCMKVHRGCRLTTVSVCWYKEPLHWRALLRFLIGHIVL